MAGVVVSKESWNLFVAMHCAKITLGDDPQNFIKVVALVIDENMPPMFPKPIIAYLQSLVNAQEVVFKKEFSEILSALTVDAGSRSKIAKTVKSLFKPSIYNMVTTYGFHRRLWAIRN